MSIVAVRALGLDEMGVMVISEVPSGLPSLALPSFEPTVFGDLLTAASGLVLVSFTSGVLTAKSFARRNGYEIDANQELVAFGACNLASGLTQGFPVTDADSPTAVNNAMGGKTQVAGLVAGGVMLLVVIFVTAPLAYAPTTALAAMILVSAMGLLDLGELRKLYRTSHREFLLSVGTTIDVLLLGTLPGVLLAGGLSLIWLLYVGSRPNDAVLGRVPGRKGFHSVTDFAQAKTIPGLLLYRFDANIVFYDAEHSKTRVRAAIAAQQTPVKWVVIDASPINVLDVTGLSQIGELTDELKREGISLYSARAKQKLARFFNPDFAAAYRAEYGAALLRSLTMVVNAFVADQKAKGLAPEAADSGDQPELSSNWRDAVQPLSTGQSDPIPQPPQSSPSSD